MEILNAILGIIFCAALVAIIYVLQKWNVKWVNTLREQIDANGDAQLSLSHIGYWPPVRYYFYTDEKGPAFVRGVYLNDVDVLIKRFTSDDAAYNKLCAEELAEKLNERI